MSAPRTAPDETSDHCRTEAVGCSNEEAANQREHGQCGPASSGYTKDETTGHGFRSMASTLLHELGFPHAVVERQLAHGERKEGQCNPTTSASILPERRQMMQGWADYLDKFKDRVAAVRYIRGGFPS